MTTTPAPTANTEPVAHRYTYNIGGAECVTFEYRGENGLIQTQPLYPESALQAERERADKAEQNYRFMVEKAADKSLDGYRELASKVLANEIRAEKAEAERDKLRAELAALKKALRNPSDETTLAAAGAYIEHGEWAEVVKAVAAHLLKD